jgi:hypothetical protein
MAEQGKKLLPVTTRLKAPDPTAALAGMSDVADGARKFVVGAVTEKLTELERADPFDTVMGKDPWVTASVYGMMALTCVALTNVVGRGEPFQFTTVPPFTKFVPFTISVKPAGLQSGAVGDCVVDPDNSAANEEIVGVGGWEIVNVNPEDVPPTGPGVNNLTVALPEARRAVDGTVATSWAGLVEVAGT